MGMETLPERLLLLAVLENGIREACGILVDRPTMGKGEIAKIIFDAVSWVIDWHDGPLEPYSFPWVCEHLDICPHRTRRIAKEYISGKHGRPPKHTMNTDLFLLSRSPDHDTRVQRDHYEVELPKRKRA